MQLKGIIDNISKGTKMITKYMHLIKTCVDDLQLMNSGYDDGDLTLKILCGLGEEFNELSAAIKARDTPISFDELHEKLVTFEAQMQQDVPKRNFFPATANVATRPHYNPQPPFYGRTSSHHSFIPTTNRQTQHQTSYVPNNNH